jgi:hypothetical protein
MVVKMVVRPIAELMRPLHRGGSCLDGHDLFLAAKGLSTQLPNNCAFNGASALSTRSSAFLPTAISYVPSVTRH